jgi:hypothetical protein
MEIILLKKLGYLYSDKKEVYMTVTLGEILKHKKIKQVDVVRTLKEKYQVTIAQGDFNHLCNKEGHWFSKRGSIIQDAISKEYGIYYDGAVWRGGK